MILMRSVPDVTVVVPAHNEAENLPPLVTELLAAQSASGRSFEILVVDDHSSDGTPAVLAGLAERHRELTVYRLARQSGQSAALAAGFDLAAGDIVVTIDADGQNDPADIPALLDRLDEADVVIGWRRDRKDPLSKRFISKVANRLRNWLTRESVRDTGCALKVFRREAVQKIPRFDGMHRFFPTLVKMYGYRVAEVPVNHRPRVRGKTHYNLFNRFARPIADTFAVRWLQRRAINYRLEREPALVHH